MLSTKLFLDTWVAAFPGHLMFCFLHMWLSHKIAAFYTEQCMSPSLFEVSWGSSNRSLNNYGFISEAIFKLCTHRLSGQFRDLTLTWNGATVVTGKQVMTLLQCIRCMQPVTNWQPFYKPAKIAFSSQHISAPGRDIPASYVKWSHPFIISTLTVHLVVTD